MKPITLKEALLDAANRAKERAEKRLQAKHAETDMIRAELALKRAITRIGVKSNH